jgi:oxygen-independent coproporphyrinogen-3 oxidase
VRVGGRDQRSRFVAALIREIDAVTGDLPAVLRSPDTVYLGGGTPSLLEAENLERILAAVRRGFSTPAETRVFLEANPEDVDADRVAAWRRLGVTFLSLGVQSFDDRDLEFLGRRHTGAEARRAIELALGAGFETVSVDLIYSLLHHDAAGWRSTLAAAVELAPDHLSCYELEIHPRTVFGKRHAQGQLAELPDLRQAELFVLTHRFLAEAGYPGYEVSNFARGEAHQSRHNRKYWRHVPYLGLGPSAHSFDGRRRWWNERSTPRWEKRVVAGQPAVAGSEELSDEDLALETLMLGLRTAAGVDLAGFRERFGQDLVAVNRQVVDGAVARGLLRTPSERLAATLDGLAVADGLAASFEVGPG